MTQQVSTVTDTVPPMVAKESQMTPNAAGDDEQSVVDDEKRVAEMKEEVSPMSKQLSPISKASPIAK